MHPCWKAMGELGKMLITLKASPLPDHRNSFLPGSEKIWGESRNLQNSMYWNTCQVHYFNLNSKFLNMFLEICVAGTGAIANWIKNWQHLKYEEECKTGRKKELAWQAKKVGFLVVSSKSALCHLTFLMCIVPCQSNSFRGTGKNNYRKAWEYHRKGISKMLLHWLWGTFPSRNIHRLSVVLWIRNMSSPAIPFVCHMSYISFFNGKTRNSLQ